MAADTTPTEANASISLVDNTAPSQSPERELTRTGSASVPSTLSKRLTRGSVRGELVKRKYAKWQPERLGISDPNNLARGPSHSSTISPTISRRPKSGHDDSIGRRSTNIESLNIVPTQTDITTEDGDGKDAKTVSELDILYENQRGCFFFGIPFYSHRSLLQFDPRPWVNRDYKDSPVDVTNAQVPDPSWQWAWRSWYVDMSDDVDEDGWQYSFSFGSKCGWHGTQPWFHSYVRRRRWVRLRVKKKYARGQLGAEGTGLEIAHRLNEDYFTIHSQNLLRTESSIAAPSGPSSASAGHLDITSIEDALLDEVEDIPTLLQVLKLAIVDRERIEALKKFIAQGGEELYYLEEKIPEILSLFVFQTSRWLFLRCLQDAIQDAPSEGGESTPEDQKEAEAWRRRRDNLTKAADAVSREISGYEVFDVAKEGHLNTGSLGPRNARRFEEIKGIPKAAGIGAEGHIY